MKIFADISYRPKSMYNIELISVKSILAKIAIFFRKFNNVLYFGNIPPFLRAKNSILYFQNIYLLQDLSGLEGLSVKIKYAIMKLQLWLCIKNVTEVCVQTFVVKEMINIFKKNINVEVLPFFRLCGNIEADIPNAYDFCYVAYPYPHKNYNVLFDALEILESNGVNVTISVTIPNDKQFSTLLNRVEDFKNYSFVRLINLGLIEKDKVCLVYKASKCIVFPSSKETLGLPLLEAAYMKCDVIVSNLQHIHEVITPSALFDANNAWQIADCMQKYLSGELPKTSVTLENKIDKLIDFFEKNT